MPDTENEPEDRRWRSTETLRELFDHMDEFWRSPEGRQLQADQLTAEKELQAWLANQSGVVVGRHGGQVPEQWEGQVDGHSFYFRERGGEWDIELDREERPRGNLIATGTIAAKDYGANPRERAAFIVNAIRNHLRRKRVTEVARMVAERSAEFNHRLS